MRPSRPRPLRRARQGNRLGAGLPGLGARQDWKDLRGVRGEVVRLYAPDVTLQRPTRLVHPATPSTWRPNKTMCL